MRIQMNDSTVLSATKYKEVMNNRVELKVTYGLCTNVGVDQVLADRAIAVVQIAFRYSMYLRKADAPLSERQ